MEAQTVGIRFGTEGWRGVISDDFTFANVRRVGQAVARYLQQSEKGAGPVVIGYDTRFLSDRYAQELAGILYKNGIAVALSDQPSITPALSLATARLQAKLGIMVTASHNPPEYNGIKIKASYGGPVDQQVIAGIEECLPDKVPSLPAAYSQIPAANLKAIYLPTVQNQVDGQAISKAGLTVVVDTMHGAGVGYLDMLLEEYGVKVVRVRHEVNPGFGSTNPEPIGTNLGPLRAAVGRHKAALGLATDGDGDRLGVVDHTGEYINAHQVFLLLLTHLVENRGQSGSVVRTFSTSSVIDQAAQSYGLALRETPIGFRHITTVCRREPVLLGGEESGGYGFPQHLLDRDGVLAGLMLVEYISQMGRPLRSLLNNLIDRYGPSFYQRIDLPLASRFMPIPEAPKQLGERMVTRIETLDGLKLHLGANGWILFRVSGTEPVLRVYAEAKSEAVLRGILEDGIQWVHTLVHRLPER
ncbi:MAG: phosphoglucomutase/phosphomannomutase family protein [Firmicutes bacterium]|nr:phosphoglucomutase/phosphomannomutase family protein [Bacillota bacterium]